MVPLLATMIIGYIFSYLYLMIMGRILGPVTFGILGALFSIFYITSLFGQTLMETIAINVAKVKALAGDPAAVAYFKIIARQIGLVCLLPMIVFTIASQPIAVFFHVDSRVPVIILALSLFAVLSLNIILGFLQGFQEFTKFGITGYLIAQGLKLVLGVAFVMAGWGLAGALGTLFASAFIASLVGLVFIKSYLASSQNKTETINMGIGRILGPALVLAIFTAVPASADVILVSHYFSGEEAGLYNAVATIGKVVFFLPMAVTFMLLPKAAEGHAIGRDTRPLLLQSLLITFVLSGTVSLVCWVFPDIIGFFFGNAYIEAGTLLGFYTTTMVVFSLNIVLIRYNLAIHNLLFLYQAALITLIEIAVIVFVHQSLEQIIWILFIGNMIIFILTFIFSHIKKSR